MVSNIPLRQARPAWHNTRITAGARSGLDPEAWNSHSVSSVSGQPVNKDARQAPLLLNYELDA